jgi:predicted phage terminase large subunit-like protein
MDEADALEILQKMGLVKNKALTLNNLENLEWKVKKAKAARSLKYFVQLMWKAVEPATEFVDGWWIDALCLHLEAVCEGKLKRLVVNCPPGFCKSLITDVFFPAWVWGPKKKPWSRFICVSYSQSLTERDNMRFLQVVNHPTYQKLWGLEFDVGDNRIKVTNSKTGWKLATSVMGVGTGERGDYILVDDPNNVQEVESEAIRESTNRWLREVMPTRLNNPVESRIVVIQQRCHEDDATGFLLEQEKVDWEHLCVPMRFDPERRCETRIGWVDPREEEGELAWPERYPEEVVSRDESVLGQYAVAGQYQQLPVPRGGSIIPVEMWKMWPPEDGSMGWAHARDSAGNLIYDEYGEPKKIAVYPEFEYVLVSLDTAMTVKETSDYSACTVWGIFADANKNNKILLIEAWRQRLNLNALVRKVMETCERRQADMLLVEDKAHGHAVAEEVRRLMRPAQFAVKLWNPGRMDKVARLQSVEPLFSNGMVYAPDRKWARMVIDEVASVPRGRYDDLADTVSQALMHLRKISLAVISWERMPEEPKTTIATRSRIAMEYGL